MCMLLYCGVILTYTNSFRRYRSKVQLCSNWKSWLSKRKIHDSLRNAVKIILLKQWRRPFYKLLKSFFSSSESWGNSRTETVL